MLLQIEKGTFYCRVITSVPQTDEHTVMIINAGNIVSENMREPEGVMVRWIGLGSEKKGGTGEWGGRKGQDCSN